MKELNIEQKAIAYDEAIERAKKVLLDCTSEEQKVVEYIYPELAESEDDMIRKALIDLVKCNERSGYKLLNNIPTSSMIAWLEKQGHLMKALQITNRRVGELIEENYYLKENLKKQSKQKPNIIVLKFKVGDWIINTITKEVEQVIELTDCEYICSGHLIVSFNNQHLLKRWTIQDAKDGDVLCAGQLIILFKQWEDNTDCNFAIAHAGIDISGKLQITDKHWLISNESKPASKEQCDILFSKIKEAGYEFDTERKEMKKIEQNKENAGITIEDIEESLLAYKIIVMDNDPELANYIEEEISWLKSLKRYIWKPSNKQLEALKDAIHTIPFENPSDSSLWKLYEQLKKLKEE